MKNPQTISLEELCLATLTSEGAKVWNNYWDGVATVAPKPAQAVEGDMIEGPLNSIMAVFGGSFFDCGGLIQKIPVFANNEIQIGVKPQVEINSDP